jgi:ATP-dependent 26S proteasome regulatory subunit
LLIGQGIGNHNIIICIKLARAKLSQEPLKNYTLNKSVNLKHIANKTDGFSGAELKALVMEAGMKAISEGQESVTESDFSLALSTIEENRKEKVPDYPPWGSKNS